MSNKTPYVATSNSQAQGNQPVNPPLTEAGSQAHAQVVASQQAAYANFAALSQAVASFAQPVQGPELAAPVVSPWINLGIQTGALHPRKGGPLLQATDLSINTAVARSKMRAVAAKDEAIGNPTLTGLAGPMVSANLAHALEAGGQINTE